MSDSDPDELARMMTGFNQNMLTEGLGVAVDYETWLCVHAALLLALRHPQNVGKAADIVREFAESLAGTMVETGFMSQELFDLAHKSDLIRRGPLQ